MSFARKWIFPIVWIVVFAAIASALVKIAFFPDRSEAADPAHPSAQIVEPQYQVIKGTVTNDVSLTGSVDADTPIPIPAILTGEVREVYVSKGQAVTAGQEILSLKAVVTNPDGTTYNDWETVTAPAAGVLSTFSALVGQNFSVGDPVGQVAPPSFHVSGSIPAEQLYRLLNKPADAQVTINGGPAPFTCTGLTITAATAGTGGGTSGGGANSPGDGGGTPSGGPVVSCTVPPEITVFAGLTAKMVIAGGVAADVLIVPVTAVEGTAIDGKVYLVGADGSSTSTPVTLGLNDGTNVEVLTGLKEGDSILEFVPGAASVDPSQCGNGAPSPVKGC